MAEGQMGAKEKGVSSDDINNLSDSAYQNLLDEALNIKSVSLHNKSPMMQTLLKEVAIDDDDFSSNVREMVDVVTETSGVVVATNKKLRSERRCAKDDQHRLHNSSAASRNSQGGSLQNLSGCGSRKADMLGSGEGRGRGRLQKSGSTNSFIPVMNDKLESLSWNGGNKLKTRSRSQGVSESEVNSVSDETLTARDAGKIKKCNYGSLSFDSATRTRCCQKQTRRKSTPTCPGDFVEMSANCVGNGDHEVGDGRWTLPGPGEEIEMMEIDHSDEECPNKKTPLLRSTTSTTSNSTSGPMKIIGRKNNSCEQGEGIKGSAKTTCETHVEVDKVIAMPFQVFSLENFLWLSGAKRENVVSRNNHHDDYNGDAKRDKNCGKFGDGPQILTSQSFLNSVASNMDCGYLKDDDHDNGVGNWSGCNSTVGSAEKHALSQQNKKKKNLKSDMSTIEFNHSDSKVIRSQLDVNGNPLDDQSRNLSLQNSIQRPRFNQEIVELNRITTTIGDADKRRKHKRTKANNTLKEMKAGEIQGNRGDDPLDSLVAFINSSDKKTATVKNPEPSSTVTTTNAKSSLTTKNNNKVHQSAKAKKQEKENNKRNLPAISLVDGSSTLVIKNGGQPSEQCDNDDSGSYYDLLKIESIVDKIHRNAAHEPVIPNALEEHVNGTIKVQTVRKAHSWEGASLPNSITVGKTMSLEGDLMEVSCDGGVVLVPCHSTCEPSVISSFVSDFYAVADVPQVVEESEFHVVLPKKFRRNNRYLSRGGDSGRSERCGGGAADRSDFESFTTGSSGSGDDTRKSSRHHRWNYSGQDEMMLLAGLPIGHHRNQRGSADSRRKSTSSMPPSDHSSVDNSDLDSVHSLPVKSTTVKPTIAKTSSSGSSTPQASYADIAKMAAASTALPGNVFNSPSPSSSSSSSTQRTRSLTLQPSLAQPQPQAQQQQNSPLFSPQQQQQQFVPGAVQRSGEVELISLPPRNLPLSRRCVKSSRNNKKDASTCTTDDIPSTRSTPPQQITHWASYPTLAEATGKTDPNSGGAVMSDKSNDSSSPSKESDSSSNVPNTTTTTTSSSSPESTDSANAVRFQDGDARRGSSVGGSGGGASGGGGGDSVSPSSHCSGNLARKAKDDEDENNTSTTSSSPPTTTTAATDSEKESRPSAVVMMMTSASASSSLVTKRKKETAVSQTGSNSSSSEASGSSEMKMSTKGTRRSTSSSSSTMKNLPAVVIMNNYKPGPCQVDVSFGFEVNELLLQTTGSSSENPSPSVNTTSSDEQPRGNAGPPMSTIAAAASAAAAVATAVVPSSSPAACVVDASAETSSASSTSPDLTIKVNRDHREVEETINFNYSNIVDFFMQSWDGVVKEIEKEKGSGLRHVKYHSNN